MMKIKLQRSTILAFIILTLFSLPIVAAFFRPGAVQTYDTMYRLTRAAKFYIALREGQLLPKWVGDVDNGVGSPIFTYLYPLPSATIAMLHFAKFSLIDALDVVWIGSTILSGLAMFIFLRNMLPWLPALGGSIFYLWVPYRFVQLYIRGALEEVVAYVFLPLVFLSLVKIYQNDRAAPYWGGLVLGLLFLTHSVTSLMFLPIFGAFCLLSFFSKPRKKELTRRLLVLTSLALGLGAITLLPNLFEKNLIQLSERLSSPNLYLTNLVPWTRLLYSKWERYPFPPHTVGFAQLAILFLALVFLAKTRNLWHQGQLALPVFLCYCLSLAAALTVFGLIVDSPVSRFLWTQVTLMHVIYVPYLLLQIVVFATSTLAAILFSLWKKNVLTVAFIVLAIVGNSIFLKPDISFNIHDEDLYSFGGSLSQFYEFYPQTTTHEDRLFRVYPPVRTFHPDTHIKLREKLYHRWTVDINSPQAEVLTLQQLYFPGWQAKVDEHAVPISYTRETLPRELYHQSDTNAGLMQIPVPSGKHRILLQFIGTPWRRIGEMLTIVTAIFLTLAFFIRFTGTPVKRKMSDTRGSGRTG